MIMAFITSFKNRISKNWSQKHVKNNKTYFSDTGIKGARDSTTLAWLVSEGDLHAIDGQGRLSAVGATVLSRKRTVQLGERLL